MDRQLAEEIISEYVSRLEDKSSDCTGVHVIPYGSVFIALETRKNHRNRYLGWFSVYETPVDMLGWAFVDKFGEGYIYQNQTDFLE